MAQKGSLFKYFKRVSKEKVVERDELDTDRNTDKSAQRDENTEPQSPSRSAGDSGEALPGPSTEIRNDASGDIAGDRPNDGTTPPPEAQPSLEKQDGKQQKSAKQYKFQESWRTENEWLRYDQTKKAMYCQICRRFDKSGKKNTFRDDAGCSSLRLANVNYHKHSEAHQIAARASAASKIERHERPIEKQLTKLNKEQIEKMRKYFTTSFYIAERNKPYQEFPHLMDLQLHNFADDKLADTYSSYKTDKKCREFVDYIAEDIINKLVVAKIDDDSFISILADGSTDKSNTEQEMIYVCMLQENKPVTQFVTLVSIPKANAENITAEIIDTLTRKLQLKKWTNNVVACCFDGAAVMLGALNGVATRLTNQAKHIITVHCCAHRLELAIKDLWKDLPYLDEMDTVLKESYNFYKLSRTNWIGLQDAGKALTMTVKRPIKLHGTRWVAHHYRALSAVHHNWPAMIVHLEDVRSNGDKSKRDHAADLLDQLRSLTFICIMNFMMVYLTAMKELSLTMQRNDITVDHVVDKIEVVKLSLKKLKKPDKLKETISKDMSTDNDDGNDMKYREEKVGFSCTQNRETRGQANKEDTSSGTRNITEKITKAAEQVINNSINKIDERFNSLVNNRVVQAAKIINPQNWPEDPESLEDYGDEEIECLYTAFQKPLQTRQVENVDICKVHWNDFKQYISRRRKNEKSDKHKPATSSAKVKSTAESYHDMWTDILSNEGLCKRFQKFLPVVKIVLVLPVHTANVERGFSQMNMIMNDKRNCLTTESLRSLLTVKLSNYTFKTYDPIGAIVLWSPWNRERKRRTESKPYGPRPKAIKLSSHASAEPKDNEDDDPGPQEEEPVQQVECEKSESEESSVSDFENDDISTSGGKGIAKLMECMMEEIGWDSEEEEFMLD